MRLIDAESTKKLAQEHLIDPYHIVSACAVIDKAKTVDAVQVVRCRECKSLIAVKADNGDAMQVCHRTKSPVSFDDFCSRGEKEN